MMNHKMRVLVPQKHISRNLTSGSPLSSSAGVPVMGTLQGTRRTFLKREELQENIIGNQENISRKRRVTRKQEPGEHFQNKKSNKGALLGTTRTFIEREKIQGNIIWNQENISIEKSYKETLQGTRRTFIEREELQGNIIGNQENISIKRKVTREHYREPGEHF